MDNGCDVIKTHTRKVGTLLGHYGDLHLRRNNSVTLSNKRDNLMLLTQQPLDQGAADESGSTGY